MSAKRPVGFFITGTNTGVGKTFVAAALARTLVDQGVRVGVYKPVASGCRSNLDTRCDFGVLPGVCAEGSSDSDGPPDDGLLLWRAAGCPGNPSQVSPQRFREPLAPPLAARAEGLEVDSRGLRTGFVSWQERSDCVIVEGAGGLFSPIAAGELNADLALDLAIPLILVAANELGVIHATLATLYAARTYRGGLPFAAVIANDVPSNSPDASRASNFGELARWCAPCPVFRHGAHGTRTPELAAMLRDEGAFA